MGKGIGMVFGIILLTGVLLAGCRQEKLEIMTPIVDVPTRVAAIGTATPPSIAMLRATATGEAAGDEEGVGSAEASATRRTVVMATRASTATATRRPPVAATAAQTAAATWTATATAGATDIPQPSATAATAVATLGAAPVIHSFELVAEEALNPGKRLTFSWSAEGDEVRLLAETQMRFMPWWVTPISGTMTIELQQSLFPDPQVVLQAFGPPDENGLRGDPVSASITIAWPCEYEYFFKPAPERCPRDAATMPAAAIQMFEGGRMVWLQPEGTIVVLYNAGLSGAGGAQMRVFDDLWREGDPEVDPNIVPPEGRLQPARGFGKVWRENADVRDTLGWATAPEAAFTATWQFETNESIGSTSYLQLNDGRIVQLYGYYLKYGSWQTLEQ